MSYIVSTHIYAVSDGVANENIQLIKRKKKIERFYMGVDVNEFNKQEMRKKYAFNENELIITCIAFHSYVKGVDILLESIKILLSKGNCPKFKLCLIGQGEDTGKLQKYAEENHLSNIYWMGLQDQVPEILASSDIYVQPSRNEGIGMALMEASMAGLPLIGSNVGGIPEIVIHGETGILVESQNSTELANILYQMMTNEDLRRKMGCSAKGLALEKFNIEIQSKSMVEKYISK